jgi:hypothetical protein
MMHSRIIPRTTIGYKASRSRRFIFILFFGNIAIIFSLQLYFYFNDTHTHVCNRSDSDITTFHSTTYKDDCNSQIDVGRRWHYKNETDGTWRCWSITNPVSTFNQTSA